MRAVRVALALAAAFGAWEVLWADFMADDLMQLGVLEGVSPAAAWTGRFGLYTISDGDPAHVRAMQDAGLFPWFFAPTFRMAFLRPLSSALLALDHAVFGLHASGYRLHGVLWSLALVGAVAMILRRALPGRLGAMALVVFVVSGIHGIFCWTATRHVVVAAALGFAGLAAHMAWREDRWRPGAVLSVIALALSLAASEVGVAVAVYLLAYETLGAPGPPRARLRAALPACAVLGLYVLAWRFLGYGTSPGSGYVDPLREPGVFLRELPIRLAALTGGVVAGGGADLWVLMPDARRVQAIGGAVLALGFAVLVRAAWRDASGSERRTIRWLGAAAIGSAIPVAGTPIGSRFLVVPFVGGAALVTIVVGRWWTEWRRRSGVGYRALGAASAWLAVVHLGFAPLARLAMPVLLQRVMGEPAASAVRDAELDPATFPTETAIVLVAPDLPVGLHGAAHRLVHRLPLPAGWRVLSWARGPHRFVRTASDTLEMEIGGGGIESPALTPGTVVTLRGLTAVVLVTGDLGPTRVRVRLDRSLDDASVTLLAWREGRLRRIDAPPVGGEIVLPSRPLGLGA